MRERAYKCDQTSHLGDVSQVYLLGCDAASVQQGQQGAEGCGTDSGGGAAGTPHQVGQQDVGQELL